MQSKYNLPDRLHKELILFQLNEAGIRTIGDLDRLRRDRSRNEFLTSLVGVESAALILEKLAQMRSTVIGSRGFAQSAFLATLLLIAVVFAGGFVVGRTSARGDATARAAQAVWNEIADCSLEEARAGKCIIPCSTDTDCFQKNGGER